MINLFNFMEKTDSDCLDWLKSLDQNRTEDQRLASNTYIYLSHVKLTKPEIGLNNFEQELLTWLNSCELKPRHGYYYVGNYQTKPKFVYYEHGVQRDDVII